MTVFSHSLLISALLFFGEFLGPRAHLSKFKMISGVAGICNFYSSAMNPHWIIEIRWLQYTEAQISFWNCGHLKN
jgi:hypothetical protein